MKKLLTLTLAAVLLASFMIACTHDTADPAITDEMKTDTPATTDDTTTPDTTEVATETETTADTTDPDETEPDVTGDAGTEGGTGGFSVDYYFTKLDPSFTGGIDYQFSRILGEQDEEIEKLLEWGEQFNHNNYDVDISERKEMTLLHFIRDFNISRETFEELNTIYMGAFRVSEKVGQVYTDKQVDALYGDSVTEFYREFKNPCAILLGDDLYTPAMLDGLSFEELKELGITADIIEEMMDVWGMFLPRTQFYYDMKDICLENDIEFTVGWWHEEDIEKGYKPIDMADEPHMQYDDYALFFSDAGEEGD